MSIHIYNPPDLQCVTVLPDGLRGTDCKQVRQSPAEYLQHHYIVGDDDQQALRTCPVTVRVAIASHFTWWFLARSHSFVVRNLAHAFMSACHYAPHTALKRVQSLDAPNALLGVMEGRNSQPFPILPYRMLNYFCRNTYDSAAAGYRANLMDKRNWDQSLRPNSPPFSPGRTREHDNRYGCAAYVSQMDYDDMERQGGLVRSSVGRMAAFVDGVRPAMQPFFTTQFVANSSRYQKLHPPGVVVQRRRSSRMVSMIPRHLAHAMEQVAAEVPFAVRFVQREGVWREMVQREATKYAEVREDMALRAMASRVPIQQFLAAYDATAAAGYGMPGIEPRVEQCPMGEAIAELKFPGINQQ